MTTYKLLSEYGKDEVGARRKLLRGSIPEDLFRDKNIRWLSDSNQQVATFYANEYFYKSEVYSILYADIHDVKVEVFINAAAMQYEFIITGYVPDEAYARYLFIKGN